MPTPMPTEGQRIITTLPYAGFRAMQVCVMAEVPEEEILAHCNADNPQLVTGGWHTVVRSAEHAKECGVDENAEPGPCADCPGRMHRIVLCM